MPCGRRPATFSAALRCRRCRCAPTLVSSILNSPRKSGPPHSAGPGLSSVGKTEHREKDNSTHHAGERPRLVDGKPDSVLSEVRVGVRKTVDVRRLVTAGRHAMRPAVTQLLSGARTATLHKSEIQWVTNRTTLASTSEGFIRF